jgi:acylphosphatase
VQGVGFRWFVARYAEQLGLRGWVSNLRDGRVQVVAAGEADRLADLERRLAAGPRSASVEHVEKLAVQPHTIDVKSFEIR